MVFVALGQPLACALEGLLAVVGSVFWVSVLCLVIVIHEIFQFHVALRVVEFTLSLEQDLKGLSLSSIRLWVDIRIAILIFLVRVNLRKGLRIHFLVIFTLNLLDDQL